MAAAPRWWIAALLVSLCVHPLNRCCGQWQSWICRTMMLGLGRTATWPFFSRGSGLDCVSAFPASSAFVWATGGQAVVARRKGAAVGGRRSFSQAEKLSGRGMLWQHRLQQAATAAQQGLCISPHAVAAAGCTGVVCCVGCIPLAHQNMLTVAVRTVRALAPSSVA